MGIHLAQKYGCKGVAEIADFWPESIVAYGIAGHKNPAVNFGAGTQVEDPTAENIAQAIMEYAAMPRERDQAFEENACRAAENYDFENLTRKLLAVIEA